MRATNIVLVARIDKQLVKWKYLKISQIFEGIYVPYDVDKGKDTLFNFLKIAKN